MSKENPYVHEIHVSEIREFKKCRFAHKLKFTDQFYPKIVAKALEFGTAYHAGKEVYYNPETWHYPNDVKASLAIATFITVCQQQMAALGSDISQDQKDDYNERITLGAEMLEYYFGTLAPVLDINLEPLFVEKSFSVPIYHPTTGEQLYCKCDKCWDKVWLIKYPYSEHLADCDDEYCTEEKYSREQRRMWQGLPVHLEGKIDLVLKDKRTNKVWVLDWKTTARLFEKYEWLELDEQIINYLLALYLLGLDVAGFFYHESLKTYPKPPERLTRKYQGKWYSTNKQQDTELDMFVDTVMEGDPEGYANRLYDDYIAYLENSGKKFYNRETIRKNPDHLKIAQADLYATAQEMTNPLRILYPSPSKFNCTYCEFEQVCIGRATGADYQYTLETQFEQKAPYYER